MDNISMKTYYLKIKEKFINPLKDGTKKHEYRLANPERRSIKVGDNLVLISNQDKKNYVRVSVTAFKIFKNWEEALTNYWEEDFKDIYQSLDEAIFDCHKFYTDSDVLKYGIIVFDVKPITVNYSKASVLLDTNIFIKRESSNNASSEVSKLFIAQ